MSQNIPFPYASGGQSGQSAQQQQQPQPNVQSASTTTPLPPAQAQAQQMAFQQNGALPTNPADTLAQLGQMGVTPQQLLEMFQMFQSGTLQPPSVPAVPQTANAPTPTQTAPAAMPEQTNGAPSQTAAQDVDMDKEEGELEEGEVGDNTASRGFLKTPPKGPRRRSRSPQPRFGGSRRGSYDVRTRSPPRAPANGRGSIASNAPASSNGTGPYQSMASKRAIVREFLVSMQDAGYTYDQIAQHVTKDQVLRRLYGELGLPTVASKGREVASPLGVSTLLTPENQSKAQARRPAPPTKPTAPTDRTTYLAKLQAAKNKKSEPTAPSPTAPQPALSKPTPPKPQQPGPRPAPTKINVNNDLIRQRLEALRAKQAEEQAAKDATTKSGTNAPPPPSMSSPALHKSQAFEGKSSPIGNAATRTSSGAPTPDAFTTTAHAGDYFVPPRQPTVNSNQQNMQPSASPSINRGLSLLPGLFTTGAAASPQQTPVRSPSTFSASQAQQTQIQPTASRNSDNPQSPAPAAALSQHQPTANGHAAATSTAPQRPFGLSRSASANERVIIIDSDVESEDEAPGQQEEQEEQLVPTGPFNAFPAKIMVPKRLATATPGTPGTPNPEYEKHMKNLESMRRKLAERQRKRDEKEARRKAAAVAQGHPGLNIDTDLNTASSASASEAATPAEMQVQASKPDGSAPLFAIATAADPVPSSDFVPEDASVDAPVLNSGQPSDSLLGQNLAATNDLPVDATANEEAKVDSQATTVSEASQAAGLTTPHGLESFSNLSSANVYSLQGATDSHPIGTTAQQPRDEHAPQTDIQMGEQEHIAGTGLEDEEDIDDDDLDDIYAEPATEPVRPRQIRPSTVSDSSEESDDDDGEGDGEGDEDQEESDDAMDTSSEKSFDMQDAPDRHLDTGNATGLDANAAPSSDPTAEQEDLAPTVGSVDTNEAFAETPLDEEDVLDDDVASELQPSEVLEVPDAQPAESRVKFTPYSSPLARFKDFRYHPEFLDYVPGGYKSMTYSHKIDPMKTVCPFETAGGICNDQTCPHQHFKVMTIADNDMLRLMGADRTPAKNREEEKKWKTGLTSVINELRKKHMDKDVSAIAKRIAEFRREFLGDPSKVLSID